MALAPDMAGICASLLASPWKHLKPEVSNLVFIPPIPFQRHCSLPCDVQLSFLHLLSVPPPLQNNIWNTFPSCISAFPPYYLRPPASHVFPSCNPSVSPAHFHTPVPLDGAQRCQQVIATVPASAGSTAVRTTTRSPQHRDRGLGPCAMAPAL